MWKRWIFSALAVVCLTAAPAFSQERVYRALNIEQLTEVMRALERPVRQENNALHFSVQSKFDIVLSPFKEGKSVVLSCASFRAVAQAHLGRWNSKKVPSRAVLVAAPDGSKVARLEAELDCTAGITAKTVDGFIIDFVKSLGEFEKFIKEAPPADRDVQPGRVAAAKPEARPLPKDWKITRTQVDFPLNAPSFATQTSWKIDYLIDATHGLRLTGAWFKRSGETPEWLKVLDDLHVTQLYIPYESGTPRYFDMDLKTHPSHGPWKLDKLPGGKENLLGPHGKFLDEFTIREDRDNGLLWLYNDGQFTMEKQEKKLRSGNTFAQRRQEMVLWGVYQASNYFYIMQYAFHNDGVIVCRLGSTGKNLVGHQASSHMHNALWRVQLDLGGSGPDDSPRVLARENEVYIVKHEEKPEGDGTAKSRSYAVKNEGGHDWQAQEFTTVRVVNPGLSNRLGNPIVYDLAPLRYGSARHFKKSPSDAFSHKDFWITSNNPRYHDYRDLPVYVQNAGPLGPNPVLWHLSSNLHTARDEDFIGTPGNRVPGCATVMFSGFELRPRSLFRDTPFLQAGKSVPQ